MSASTALSIRRVDKSFGGNKALDGVNLSVPEGSVFGLLGPNGAGKTTLLRILAGLSRADSGSISLFGEDPDAIRMRGALAYLPDVPGFYPWMTAREVMGLAARLAGIDRARSEERIDALLGFAGIEGVTSKVGGYSRGMRQRLGLAQALVGAPAFLMLDEPTSALDPLGRREILEMLASMRGRTTILFSTHILADVERVCDHLAIIDEGRTIRQGPIAEFKDAFVQASLTVHVASGAGHLADALVGQPWIESVRVEGERLDILATDLEQARRAIPVLIAHEGTELISFSGGEPTLEDAFVHLVGGGSR